MPSPTPLLTAANEAIPPLRVHERILWHLYEVIWVGFLVGWLGYRWIRGGEGWKEEIAQRLGNVPIRPREKHRSLWLHAVSVGEVLSIRPVIDEIKRLDPDAWVLLTTSNEAAYAMAQSRPTGADAFCRTPWDFRPCIWRALRRAQPEMLAIVECEIWPNLIRQSAVSGAKVVMINARIYAKDFPNYRAARAIFRPILACVDGIYTQSQGDLDRFRAMGMPETRLHEGGNTKFDAVPSPSTASPALSRDSVGLGDGPVWLWASTHEDEEAQILAEVDYLWDRFPDLQLVIAPRDIRRAERIEELVQAKGKSVHRRTTRGTAAAADVLVVDTLGELMQMMGLADLVFVGGSLVAKGGHNPIEPAVWSKPILMGSSVHNFADIVQVFDNAGGLQLVADAKELVRHAERLLADGGERSRLGNANRHVLAQHRGSAQRYARLLLSRESQSQAA